MKSYKIALLPGDGIGRDVTDAAWAVLEKTAGSSGFCLGATRYPWSCDYYLENGSMMPADGIDTLRSFDAILLGAVGWPRKVPDSVSLHGLLLPIRKAFVQYANIRPHRLLPGVEGPLRSNGFDILCVRENTEASIPAPAAACTRAPTARWRSKPPSSPERGSNASCVSASSKRVRGAANSRR